MSDEKKQPKDYPRDSRPKRKASSQLSTPLRSDAAAASSSSAATPREPSDITAEEIETILGYTDDEEECEEYEEGNAKDVKRHRVMTQEEEDEEDEDQHEADQHEVKSDNLTPEERDQAQFEAVSKYLEDMEETEDQFDSDGNMLENQYHWRRVAFEGFVIKQGRLPVGRRMPDEETPLYSFLLTLPDDEKLACSFLEALRFPHVNELKDITVDAMTGDFNAHATVAVRPSREVNFAYNRDMSRYVFLDFDNSTETTDLTIRMTDGYKVLFSKTYRLPSHLADVASVAAHMNNTK